MNSDTNTHTCWQVKLQFICEYVSHASPSSGVIHNQNFVCNCNYRRIFLQWFPPEKCGIQSCHKQLWNSAMCNGTPKFDDLFSESKDQLYAVVPRNLWVRWCELERTKDMWDVLRHADRIRSHIRLQLFQFWWVEGMIGICIICFTLKGMFEHLAHVSCLTIIMNVWSFHDLVSILGSPNDVNHVEWVIFIIHFSFAWLFYDGLLEQVSVHSTFTWTAHEAVSDGKPPAFRKWCGWFVKLTWLAFWVYITFCKVSYGDSVTKPDYYCYYFIRYQRMLEQSMFRERNLHRRDRLLHLSLPSWIHRKRMPDRYDDYGQLRYLCYSYTQHIQINILKWYRVLERIQRSLWRMSSSNWLPCIRGTQFVFRGNIKHPG